MPKKLRGHQAKETVGTRRQKGREKSLDKPPAPPLCLALSSANPACPGAHRRTCKRVGEIGKREKPQFTGVILSCPYFGGVPTSQLTVRVTVSPRGDRPSCRNGACTGQRGKALRLINIERPRKDFTEKKKTTSKMAKGSTHRPLVLWWRRLGGRGIALPWEKKALGARKKDGSECLVARAELGRSPCLPVLV